MGPSYHPHNISGAKYELLACQYTAWFGFDLNMSPVNDVHRPDGPKSLEILEAACQCDIHDLKFAQNKFVKIGDTDMLVLRLGMSLFKDIQSRYRRNTD
jgi:hypothetical protein